MIKAYSQRLMPPYSGQMQIVESDRTRAITLDSQTWEIQFYIQQIIHQIQASASKMLNVTFESR